MTRPNPVGILAFAMLLTILGYFYFAMPDCLRNPAACAGDATTAPGRYRVLQPALEQAFSGDVLWIDFALQAVLSVVVLAGLYLWLERWQNADSALVGCFALALLMVVSFHYFLRSIATTLELACVIGMLLAARSHFAAGVTLVFVASLNRETGLILVGIYAAYHGLTARTVSLGVMWGVITASLHLVLGSAPHMLGLEGTWAYNLSLLPDALIANLPFIPLGILAVLHYRRLPRTLKRLQWVVLVYLAAVVIGGAWSESERLLLPIMPLVLVGL